MTRIFSWRSDGRATWPRWKAVIFIELVLAVFVIGMMASLLMVEARAVLAKAFLSEALTATTPGKIAVIEHLAITGRPLATDLEGQGRGEDKRGPPEYERHLSAAQAFAAVAAASGSGSPGATARKDNSATQVRYGVRDGAIVVVGRMAQMAAPYRFVLSPVIASSGDGPTVQWACGDAPVARGYSVAAQPLPWDMPREFLSHPCRQGPRP